MVLIYLVAAVPFFTGGLVLTLAISRLASRINAVYAADLLGAAAGCIVLIPLLNRIGAPAVVFAAACLAAAAAVLFAPAPSRRAIAVRGAALMSLPLALHLSGVLPFSIAESKGHEGLQLLFSKWNSFSRIGVYEKQHGDWAVSKAWKGAVPEALYMDIDASASTPSTEARWARAMAASSSMRSMVTSASAPALSP